LTFGKARSKTDAQMGRHLLNGEEIWRWHSMGFVYWDDREIVRIVVGLIAGTLAGKVMKGGGYGVAVDIILGILGGILGGWIFGFLGLYPATLLGQIIIAFVGAMILVWITPQLKKA
jgi:uncharacterized membrane protein YeaQ/YmgE (transglycosylase-associated protein family)